MTTEFKSCKYCGGAGRHRYEKPYHWIECKKCGYKTPLCVDHYEENDPESITTAINYWNHGVKYGR